MHPKGTCRTNTRPLISTLKKIRDTLQHSHVAYVESMRLEITHFQKCMYKQDPLLIVSTFYAPNPNLLARVMIPTPKLWLKFRNKYDSRGGVVILTPNPKPEAPRCPFLSGSSPLTCMAWDDLPSSNATASINSGSLDQTNPTTASKYGYLR